MSFPEARSRGPRRYTAAPGLWEPSPPRREEELVPVMCWGESDTVFPVGLPPEWQSNVESGSLHMTALDWYMQGDWHCPILVFEMTPRRSPSERIRMHIMTTGCPRGEQDIFVGKRIATLRGIDLGAAAHLVAPADSRVFANSTFVVYPATSSDLQTLLDSQEARRSKLPLATSIVALADILRGLLRLEDVGVVHRDLTATNIKLESGRAYVAGLGSTGMMCYGEEDSAAVSLEKRRKLIDAPELSGSMFVPSSCHVWSAGLLFAQMLFGQTATEQFLMRRRRLAAEEAPQPWNHEGALAWQPRPSVRMEDLGEIEGWSRAHPRARDVLSHMLMDVSEARWTAKEALEHVLLAASDLGVEVPEEAVLPTLAGWWWSAA